MGLPALPAGFTDTGAWTFLQLLAKATLVLLLAAAVARPVGRAAARHLVWSLALGALLVLPPLTLLLPEWRLSWLRVETRALPGVPGAEALLALGGGGPGPVALALLAVWAAGALAVLGRLALGWRGVRRMARSARPVRDPHVLAELAELCRAARVSTAVRLLRSDVAAMPATWGVLRPTVLLPAEADLWSPERRRVVLLHELAHVARRDWLTQLLATLCCAVYWFHPGAWWAARRMRIEREEACDDRVLAAGARPAEYAGHLLEVARAFRRASRLSAALAMARPSHLESRVTAVLDAGRDRRGVAWGAGAFFALGVALGLLPLASATPTEEVIAAAPPVVQVPLALPAVEAVAAETPPVETRPVVAAAAPARPPAGRAARAPRPLGSPPAAPQTAAAPAAVEVEPLAMDPAVLRARSLAELIRATASPQPGVRRDAVRALAQIRDEAVVTPLARSLRDQDPGVRTMAARALGEMAVARPRPGGAQPVDAPPTPADAPAEAVLASRAAEALRVSLSDEDPRVRDTALRALEEVSAGLEGGGGSPAASALQNGISTIVAPQ